MKIDLCSDLHLDNYRNYISIENNGSDVLVIAGDMSQFNLMKYHKNFIESLCASWRHVVFVPGNHEYYRSSIDIVIDRSIYPENFYLLDNESVVIDDIVFYGGCLWNNFDDISFELYHMFSTLISDFNIIDDMTLDKATGRHLEFIDNLYTTQIEHSDKPIVVVSHFPPSQKSIHPKYKGNYLNRYFINDMDDVVDNDQIKLWCHGHTHDKHDYMIGNTRVVCNPRGYPNENGQDYQLVTINV